METTFQAFSIRLPSELHMAARLKSVRTGKTLNEIVNEKLAEWVKEPEPQPEPAEPKTRRTKSPVPA